MRYIPALSLRLGITLSLFALLAAECASCSSSSSAKPASDPGSSLLAEEDLSDAGPDTEEGFELWIDTVMSAKGHAFGYKGDISMWGGWYFDKEFVGDDYLLEYDSVSPSELKLSLVTRKLVVDLGDPSAGDKIKKFMDPIGGFSRFSKRYEECLDSVECKDYGYDKTVGLFTFVVDFPDSGNKNAGKIRRFIGELSGAPVAGKGNLDDMSVLSDLLAEDVMENWKRAGDFSVGSNEVVLAIRSHDVTDRYVTLSKFEYLREGIGHGMYTATFHTLDLSTGKELTNKDIFRAGTLGNVKKELIEVIAANPRYLASRGSSARPAETEIRLPEGALTGKGVLFSFQPYEIDSWAAGAYHFIVPYEKLLPYLSTQVQNLLR